MNYRAGTDHAIHEAPHRGAGNDPLYAIKRARLVLIAFIAGFCLIGLRLGQLTLGGNGRVANRPIEPDSAVMRPEITDRSGRLLATNVKVVSLYADPRKIIDVDEAIELLTGHLPDLDAARLRRALTMKNRAFVWLKRGISPAEKTMLHDLGIPGMGFRDEIRRVYPMGRLGAHVLGFVDIDLRGLAGLEYYLDHRGRLFTASLNDPNPDHHRPEAVKLAMDMRVQYALEQELLKAREKFSAAAAAGVVLDINSGEVIAMVSLPDFDPNDPTEAQGKDRINRITGGVYEMGSTMKAVTVAMALDEGIGDFDTTYDASRPLRIGRRIIHDYHGKNRILSLPEVFIYSSNIGAAEMALEIGADRQKAFLEKLGFFDKPRTELPESASPLLPQRWGEIERATVAFGHGIAVEPLQLAVAGAALMNGGMLIAPTFLKRDKDIAKEPARRVVSAETSRKLRYLFRLDVLEGSAKKADIEGYRIGGKTGTAEKVVDGRYVKTQRLANFLGGFPMDDPRYCVLVILDNPQALAETYEFTTSGWNAAPTAGRVIARIAPMLGVVPKFDDDTAWPGNKPLDRAQPIAQ
ncbi:MAG: penicillin-binding protein 2 [Hyphomicrobiales bacterium]